MLSFDSTLLCLVISRWEGMMRIRRRAEGKHTRDRTNYEWFASKKYPPIKPLTRRSRGGLCPRERHYFFGMRL